MENKILIFRTSITRKCDIKRIEKLLAQYPLIFILIVTTDMNAARVYDYISYLLS